MSISLGIDLVCADEVQESMRVHGDRYLERIWTEEELRDCQHDASRLAATFAAKEATMKALRTEDDDAVAWRSISVSREPASITLTGTAAELASRRGIDELSVSTARRGRLAAAVVVAGSSR
jgi:holo-[acyl-carrier protein] synthase